MTLSVDRLTAPVERSATSIGLSSARLHADQQANDIYLIEQGNGQDS